MIMMSAADWEHFMEMKGLCLSLADLRRFIDEAPQAVRRSKIYQYYQGFADGRELMERLGGVS